MQGNNTICNTCRQYSFTDPNPSAPYFHKVDACGYCDPSISLVTANIDLCMKGSPAGQGRQGFQTVMEKNIRKTYGYGQKGDDLVRRHKKKHAEILATTPKDQLI